MIGAMMAGGNPAEGRQEDDFYPTPPGVLRALLEYEGDRIPKRVWECACGDGSMSKGLVDAGFKVASTDLAHRGYGKGGVDFLKTNLSWDGAIITNPPFKIAKDFIIKAHQIGSPYIALVLKSSYWHAYTTRGGLFRDFKPSAKLDLGWRPDFLKKKAPTMEVMWCVWRKGHVGPIEYDVLPGSDN